MIWILAKDDYPDLVKRCFVKSVKNEWARREYDLPPGFLLGKEMLDTGEIRLGKLLFQVLLPPGFYPDIGRIYLKWRHRRLLKSEIVTPPGFEPGTYGLENRCSILLSYGAIFKRCKYRMHEAKK